MTKLMWCGDCGDVVSPGLKDLDVRTCSCKRHSVWWVDGAKGILRLNDRVMMNDAAYVVGLHNGLLREPPSDCTSKGWVEQELADTPPTYLFKRAHSLVVRIKPGYSNDTGWADVLLPVVP